VQRASREILKIDRNRWLLAEKQGGRKGTPNKRTAALRARLAATDSGFDPYQPHSKAVLGGVSVGGRAALRPLARFRSGHGYASPAATPRQNRPQAF
jgi:hypothetical protein